MKTEKQRVCIYPKDIQRITGKSYRQSIRLMQKVKTNLHKLENEFLTIEEFCLYTGLNKHWNRWPKVDFYPSTKKPKVLLRFQFIQ